MRARVASILVGLCAVSAQAQDARVQLDDFSIVEASGDVPATVEQVDAGMAPVADADPATDRQVQVDQSIGGRGVPVSQLSTANQSTRPEQLGGGGQASAAVQSVSTRGDSRPQGLQRLPDADRCDPQLRAAQLERCLKILESRAAEFSAPEAPELSVEQRILTERQALEEEVASQNGDIRLRLATMTRPDAGLRSNQELAALVLEPPTPSQPSPMPDVKSDTLAEALRGLAIEIQNQGVSSQP